MQLIPWRKMIFDSKLSRQQAVKNLAGELAVEKGPLARKANGEIAVFRGSVTDSKFELEPNERTTYFQITGKFTGAGTGSRVTLIVELKLISWITWLAALGFCGYQVVIAFPETIPLGGPVSRTLAWMFAIAVVYLGIMGAFYWNCYKTQREFNKMLQ